MTMQIYFSNSTNAINLFKKLFIRPGARFSKVPLTQASNPFCFVDCWHFFVFKASPMLKDK